MGSAPGSGSAQVDARQGGRGGWCRRVLVGEDVKPPDVGAVLPRAVVPDFLSDQSAQCLECEVFVLRFARRRSCAESILSPEEWTRPQVCDARAAQPVQLKEGPYQDRPPLCPFRLLPLLIYSGSAIAFLRFQGPKSKNIENRILLQP